MPLMLGSLFRGPNELSWTYGQFYFIANLKKLNTLKINHTQVDDRDLITVSSIEFVNNWKPKAIYKIPSLVALWMQIFE